VQKGRDPSIEGTIRVGTVMGLIGTRKERGKASECNPRKRGEAKLKKAQGMKKGSLGLLLGRSWSFWLVTGGGENGEQTLCGEKTEKRREQLVLGLETGHGGAIANLAMRRWFKVGWETGGVRGASIGDVEAKRLSK